MISGVQDLPCSKVDVGIPKGADLSKAFLTHGTSWLSTACGQYFSTISQEVEGFKQKWLASDVRLVNGKAQAAVDNPDAHAELRVHFRRSLSLVVAPSRTSRRSRRSCRHVVRQGVFGRGASSASSIVEMFSTS